jgi:tetratricopeptide (TPR) repeat protein
VASDESTSHMALSLVLLERRSFDMSLRHMERAVEINPNNAWHQADFGMLLARIGRAEESLERLVVARNLDRYFEPAWYWPALGVTQFVLGRYSDAILDFERGTPSAVDQLAVMAGCCAKLGFAARAQALVAQCLAVQPEATITELSTRIVFKDPDDGFRLVECLHQAGFPP